MKEVKNIRQGPKGPESTMEEDGVEKKVLKLQDVKGLLKRDVHACILMLTAIHDDQDVMDALALSLHGKYMNRVHKTELDSQLEIKP